jgi:hypothetical protein
MWIRRFNEAVANAADVREEGLRRKGEKLVMISFVLLSWNASGRSVLCHEVLSTIDVGDEKLQSSPFNKSKTK